MSVSHRYSDIEKAILRKMLMDRIIGARHTSIDNVPKGFKNIFMAKSKKPQNDSSEKGTSL